MTIRVVKVGYRPWVVQRQEVFVRGCLQHGANPDMTLAAEIMVETGSQVVAVRGPVRMNR